MVPGRNKEKDTGDWKSDHKTQRTEHANNMLRSVALRHIFSLWTGCDVPMRDTPPMNSLIEHFDQV